MSARIADEPILKLLAEGRTVTETAEILGISTGVIYERKRERVFRARLAELRGQEFAKIVAKAAQTLDASLATYQQIIDDITTSTKDRLAAIKARDELLLKLRDDLADDRLETLEATSDVPLEIRD